ncbi:YlbF family regulator [Paenibacillus methanolicus]|uniref:UPF0342 protein BCM02_110129 n=1 Tax=Paenibacillus methanolicus TaxID=582686 RepID=A0A5S5BW25_9BACL|nr:YlbF family regulator [Paenibacillus methanolicus]TYP71179.1 cell fate (sporulation/competence/biofilm development) regulator YlbF (YheA/YmcA/DUF963 family) [Paenibacillus methanolicus]
MNVYDKAYDLAKALTDGEEAKALKAAQAAVDADPEAKRLMDDFRERQAQLQQQIMAGEEPSEDVMAGLSEQYESIARHPLIGRLFDAERRFSAVFDDVNRIISDALRSVAG